MTKEIKKAIISSVIGGIIGLAFASIGIANKCSNYENKNSPNLQPNKKEEIVIKASTTKKNTVTEKDSVDLE